MRVAWSPAKEVKFTALEENLFTIQCFCFGDWLNVDRTWLSSNPMTVLFRLNPWSSINLMPRYKFISYPLDTEIML
jgi:hypothetical protein